jgi:hypothetical protein
MRGVIRAFQTQIAQTEYMHCQGENEDPQPVRTLGLNKLMKGQEHEKVFHNQVLRKLVKKKFDEVRASAPILTIVQEQRPQEDHEAKVLDDLQSALSFGRTLITAQTSTLLSAQLNHASLYIRESEEPPQEDPSLQKR